MATDEAEDALYGERVVMRCPSSCARRRADASSSRQPRRRLRRDDADAEERGEEPEAQAAEEVPRSLVAPATH
jgi:hypothetical protein